MSIPVATTKGLPLFVQPVESVDVGPNPVIHAYSAPTPMGRVYLLADGQGAILAAWREGEALDTRGLALRRAGEGAVSLIGELTPHPRGGQGGRGGGQEIGRRG